MELFKFGQIVTLEDVLKVKEDNPAIIVQVSNPYSFEDHVHLLEELEDGYIRYTYNEGQVIRYPKDMKLQVQTHTENTLVLSKRILNVLEPTGTDGEDNIITLKELAIDLGTSPKALRKWLRDNNIEKPGSRWEWVEGDKAIDHIKELRQTTKRGRPKKVLKVASEPVTNLDPYIIESVGKWNVWKNPESGAVQAIYEGPKSTDKTPWYLEESEIRPSLPKKVKEVIINNLPN